MQADGGIRRIVWMPKELKERFKDAIPADLFDKIATEDDVDSADKLVAWLNEKGHPWVKGEVEIPS
jgi:acetyl-CoA decarbonylase/synthase complex subunit beta